MRMEKRRDVIACVFWRMTGLPSSPHAVLMKGKNSDLTMAVTFGQERKIQRYETKNRMCDIDMLMISRTSFPSTHIFHSFN
mmetsp:Transcript_14666/g.19513  ORF Transcript_14666/g.19513 Transcript_14666/m.19513 type:complete len:81 (+) Transcript_14666:412-654(+)